MTVDDGAMTVEELIEELQKVKHKHRLVVFRDDKDKIQVLMERAPDDGNEPETGSVIFW